MRPPRDRAWLRFVFAVLVCAVATIPQWCQASPGDLIWMSVMVPGSSPGAAVAGMALDSHNNIYVAGSVHNPNGYGLDLAVAKYSIRGVGLWMRTYNGKANGDDWATGVVVDSQDNVIVTGISDGGPATGYDIVTASWAPNGWQNWLQRYDGPGHGHDGSCAIVTDGRGDTLIAGWTQVSGASQWETVVLKYNIKGGLLWSSTYTGATGANTVATALAVDSAGNSYLTGYTWRGSTGLMDYVTLKYAISGALTWANRYAGPGHDWDVPVAVGVDGSGDVYVTGSSVSATGYGGIATIKYDPTGNVLWTKRYDPTASASIQAYAMSVQPDGTAYVTGCAQGGYDSAGNPLASILTVQYTAAGAVGWTNTYQPTSDSYASPAAIAVDPLGEVFVAGWELLILSGSGYKSQGITMKIDSSGHTAWATASSEPNATEGGQVAVALSHAGYVVTAGQFGSGWDINGVPEFNWAASCYIP